VSGPRPLIRVYVEHFLAPTLREGQVVVLDNPGAHKKPKRIRELIEERGAEVLFLSSYSPDLNPIEEAFSKIKAMLRRAARTKDALIEMLGQALLVISAQDARGYFEHAGYCQVAQLL
jgi:transposase